MERLPFNHSAEKLTEAVGVDRIVDNIEHTLANFHKDPVELRRLAALLFVTFDFFAEQNPVMALMDMFFVLRATDKDINASKKVEIIEDTLVQLIEYVGADTVRMILTVVISYTNSVFALKSLIDSAKDNQEVKPEVMH